MHIPTGPINIRDSALSGAQAVEESAAILRARQLRATASKLSTSELDMTPDIATDEETSAVLSAWSSQAETAGREAQSTPDHDSPREEGLPPQKELQATIDNGSDEVPNRAISFWA